MNKSIETWKENMFMRNKPAIEVINWLRVCKRIFEDSRLNAAQRPASIQLHEDALDWLVMMTSETPKRRSLGIGIRGFSTQFIFDLNGVCSYDNLLTFNLKQEDLLVEGTFKSLILWLSIVER